MNIPERLYIDGKWRIGRGGFFSSHDPSTGESVWTGRAADESDVEAACAAARRAFHHWSLVSTQDRAAVLTRFREILETRLDSLSEAISREVGKPRWEARTEVQAMINKIPISVEAHHRRCAEFHGGPAITRFRPHGVVAVFGPFNFPGHLPNGHIVPALLAGNTVVFKPSERAPGVGALAAQAWSDAGLPAGCLNLVQGGRETGAFLVDNAGIDGLFFTGSAVAGLAIHRRLAGQPDKILALEMGGNNPLVVWEPVDHEGAVVATLQSAFLSAGQRCTCARRLVVAAGADGDRFIERLCDAIAQIRVGTWRDDPEPFMGPVIAPDAALRLLDAQSGLERRGARVLVALRHLADGTGRVSPGLIDVTGLSDREDAELFGPLLQLIRVPDFNAAIAEANNTRFGLAAGLFCNDAALWHQFRRTVRAGIINWNHQLTGASSAAPFGGVGLSGNHRPSAYLAADYCSFPVAGIEQETLALPATSPPGLP